MPDPGDVVIVEFVGAMGIKRRPTVVVSTKVYHSNRPDVVLAVLTTQVSAAASPTDYVLKDWAAAGLKQPSAFRAYFAMKTPAEATFVGRLTARDWEAVQGCLAVAIAVPDAVP